MFEKVNAGHPDKMADRLSGAIESSDLTCEQKLDILDKIQKEAKK